MSDKTSSIPPQQNMLLSPSKGKNPQDDNSDSQIYILSSIQETALHLSIYDTFPKYDIVSNNSDLQNHPFNLLFETMTSIKDRKKAKQDFIELTEVSAQVLDLLNQFKEKYPSQRESQKVLSWYFTKQFYRNLVDKGLKTFNKITQFTYIRLPFTDIYHSIKQLCEEKLRQNQYREGVTCFCTKFINQKYMNKFDGKIGEYVFLKGFLECLTCENRQINKSIVDECLLFQIVVPPKENALKANHGFLVAHDIRPQFYTRKVLFNPMNTFKILSVNKQSPLKVTLQFQWQGLEGSQTNQNAVYLQEDALLPIKTSSRLKSKNFGTILTENNQLHQAQKWYEQKLKRKGLLNSLPQNPQKSTSNTELRQYKEVLLKIIKEKWKKNQYHHAIFYTSKYEEICKYIYPEPVQYSRIVQMLQQENIQQIKNLQIPFEQKQTQLGYCTYFFKSNEVCYTCHDCCLNGDICYCKNCWRQSEHESHNYEESVIHYEGRSYCDCGRQYRMKEESFCRKHRKNPQITVQKEQRYKFIYFFYPLFSFEFYLRETCKQRTKIIKQVNLKIIQSLEKLTEKSAYYIRLTYQLMNRIVEIKQTNKTYNILSDVVKKKNFKKLIWNMLQDYETRVNMTRFYINQRNGTSGRRMQLHYECVIEDLFEQTKIMLQLANQCIFIEKEGERYLNYAKNEKHGKDIFNRFVCFMNQKQDQKFVSILNFCIYEEEILPIDKISLTVLLTKFLKHTTKQSQSHPPTLLFISSLIFHYSEGNLLKINDKLDSLFRNKQFKNFNKFLSQTMKNYYSILSECNQQLRSKLFISLFLVSRTKEREQLIQVLWQNIFHAQASLLTILDAIFTFICIIANYPIILSWESKKTSKKEDEIQNQKIQEEWFKSYLYEKQQIRKVQIWQLKKNSKLNFKNAGKILNQLCYFSEEKDCYMYDSIQVYENPFIKFDYRHETGSIRNILKVKMKIDDEVPLDDHQELIFNLLFTNKNLFKNLVKKWDNLIKQFSQNLFQKNRMKNLQVGKLFVLILIFIDRFSKGKNPEISEELEKLKNSVEYRTKYIQVTDDNSFNTLFPQIVVQKPKEKEQEEIETKIAHSAEVQKKLQQKKRKLKQKYKNKQKKVIENNQSKASSQKSNEELEECLVCHRVQKLQEPFVYLSVINKEKTASSSIHKEQNICKTLFSTCFHSIHISCYIEMQKDRGISYSCPLCSRRGNCILPVSATKLKNRRTNMICQNAINTTLIVFFKFFEFENSFILLFKHLVETKGLERLLSIDRYGEIKAKNEKLDNYILLLLKGLYENASKDIKKVYEANIQQMLQQVKVCSKGYLQVQQILIKCLRSLIIFNKQEVDLSLYCELKQILYEREFDIIESQLSSICPLDQIKIKNKSQDINYDGDKISLTFKIQELPPSTKELQKYKTMICKKCVKKGSYRICLICGDNLCERCQDRNSHRQQHYGSWLAFIPRDASILLENKRKSEQSNIYYNQFKMPYAIKDDSDEEAYVLNKKSLDRVVEEFLSSF